VGVSVGIRYLSENDKDMRTPKKEAFLNMRKYETKLLGSRKRRRLKNLRLKRELATQISNIIKGI